MEEDKPSVPYKDNNLKIIKVVIILTQQYTNSQIDSVHFHVKRKEGLKS